MADFGEDIAAQLRELVAQNSTHLSEREYLQPVSTYTDPELLLAERQRLFRGLPLMVGLSSEWSEPGDFRTMDVDGLAMLVVRQDDGTLRAFHNVCRHRGTQVVTEESGCRHRFRCVYHSWTYRVDGSLQAIPSPEAFNGVDRTKSGLVEVPVGERHGLVWLGPVAGPAVDLDEFIGELGPVLDQMGLASGGVYRRERYELQTNWKLPIDTFQETYHLPHLHRNTIAKAAYPPSVIRQYGLHGSLYSLAKNDQVIVAMRLFPNTILLWVADQVEIYVSVPDPVDPNRCLVTLTMVSPTLEVDEADQPRLDRFWDLAIRTTVAEDFPAAESMQRNFASPAQDHLVFGRNELAIHHFYDTLRQTLQLEPAPSS
jgi:phenylpropionate dioxygenase-like ring-hydroxylating dioxygenase large terminal subunit